MAAETYAFNFFNEDLSTADASNSHDRKTLWISSAYPRNAVSNRLRENPFNYPPVELGFSDLPSTGEVEGKLLVGSIIELNRWLLKNPKALAKIQSAFGHGEIDLLSGGPPCQSFSMAGLRQKDSDKNSLPWEFASFAKQVKPKLILLENVSGILRPFKDATGQKYHAWFEISKAFVEVDYIPLCMHVNAKFVGVPQNRPRFILLGIRSDLIQKILKNSNFSEHELLKSSSLFYEKVKSKIDVSLEDLRCWDLANSKNQDLIKTTFLKYLISHAEHLSVHEAIGDLFPSSTFQSKFKENLASVFCKVIKSKKLSNHEYRSNSSLVQRRFRIYQVLNELSSSSKVELTHVLNGRSSDISPETWREVSRFKFLVETSKLSSFKTKTDLINFIVQHKTKKRTQKALIAHQPAPAALSIPDDACHYHVEQLRTLSVREMARIQSFPDDFEFRSKITTGGKMRRYEVPQYTQVGNAVPPLLGRALGLSIKELLKRVGK